MQHAQTYQMGKTLAESTSERNWRVAREEREYEAPAKLDETNPFSRFGAATPQTESSEIFPDHSTDSGYAIYMLDSSGNILSWNSGAEHFNGHTPSEYEGQHFSRLYSDQAQREMRPAKDLQTAIENGRYEDEGWSLRADGSRFWAHVIIDLIKSKDGSHVGFVKVIRDISERRVTQLRLHDLHTANRELEQFIHIASHDLREPLRKLQSFNSLLVGEEGDNLSAQARTYLDNMMAATRRMQELLSSLLTLTRVTSQAQAFEPTDLNEVLRDVCTDLAVLITESEAEIKISELGKLNADQAQLRQLFQNLISNGIKYARQGVKPELRISQLPSRRGEKITIVVQDNGIGFDPQYREKIFGIFQRLHGRDKYAGAGIGLAICRKICERHGGQITAQSQAGNGSRFNVELALNMSAKKADA